MARIPKSNGYTVPSQDLPRKRIIVACDGTWMDSDGTTRIPSNITRIVRAIPSIGYEADGKPISQVTFYQNGVGTGSGGLYSQYIGKYVSGATGEGLDYNIREAYQFICANYTVGDEIILLGFSRGAFTARSISTLIKQCGLLTARGLNHLVEIADDWEHQQNPDYKSPFPGQPWTGLKFTDQAYHAKLLELGMTQPVIPVKCVAVWDTVGALGLPSIAIFPERRAQEFAFIDTRIEDNIEYAFHALGLDERRRAYAPTIWYKPESQTYPKVLKQTWFPGVHSDIGGSYANDDIANITLAWMVGQLEEHQIVTFNREYILNMVQKTIQRHAWEVGRIAQVGLSKLTRAATMGPIRKWGLGKIHDSYSMFFKLGGATVRTPCEHPEYARKTRKPTGKFLQGTHERMHASVRVRMALGGKGYDDQGEYVSDALKGWYYNFGSLAQPDTPWQKTQPGEVGRLKNVVWAKSDLNEDGKEVEVANMPEDTMTEFERLVLRHWTIAEDDWEDGADEREWEIDTARPVRRESHKHLDSADATQKIVTESRRAIHKRISAVDEEDEDDDASRQLRLETNLHRSHR